MALNTFLMKSAEIVRVQNHVPLRFTDAVFLTFLKRDSMNDATTIKIY
jgi:hypothetical protein